MMAAAMKAHFVIQELSAHVGMHPRYPGQIPVPVAHLWISNVPDHLSKNDNLYELYKSSVKEQHLKFEQSMLSNYLIKSLPDSYHLVVKQSSTS